MEGDRLQRQRMIRCPKQTQNTGVILVLGQSNAANHAEYLFKRHEVEGVVNYYDGHCYAAASPLLGATGERGEWLSKTANHLVQLGIYEEVVVVSAAVAVPRSRVGRKVMISIGWSCES